MNVFVNLSFVDSHDVREGEKIDRLASIAFLLECFFRAWVIKPVGTYSLIQLRKISEFL